MYSQGSLEPSKISSARYAMLDFLPSIMASKLTPAKSDGTAHKRAGGTKKSTPDSVRTGVPNILTEQLPGGRIALRGRRASCQSGQVTRAHDARSLPMLTPAVENSRALRRRHSEGYTSRSAGEAPWLRRLPISCSRKPAPSSRIRVVRLRGKEAVTVDGDECDPCGLEAARFCAIGALIHVAHRLVGDRELAHELGWRIAGEVAIAAGLPSIDEDERGWGLAMLSDRRGQAATLEAIDTLIGQRRG